MLDEIDLSILRLLQQNPRISYSEIGRELGFSRNAIKYRISEMHREGFLLGFRIILDTKKFGKTIRAIISIKTELRNAKLVKKNLLKKPELIRIFRISGEYSFLTIGLFKDQNNLQDFLNNSLSKLPIREYEVEIVIDELKEEDFRV